MFDPRRMARTACGGRAWGRRRWCTDVSRAAQRMQPRKKGRRGARKKALAAKQPAPLPAGTSAERSARHLRHLARNQRRADVEPKPTYTCAGVHEDLRKADKIPPPPTDAQRVLLPTLSAHGNFMRALAPVLANTHSALKGPQKIKIMGFVWSKMQAEEQQRWARRA